LGSTVCKRRSWYCSRRPDVYIPGQTIYAYILRYWYLVRLINVPPSLDAGLYCCTFVFPVRYGATCSFSVTADIRLMMLHQIVLDDVRSIFNHCDVIGRQIAVITVLFYMNIDMRTVVLCSYNLLKHKNRSRTRIYLTPL